MNAAALFLTVFLACAVEAVEALTIILAAGLTRDWRSTWQGMAAALAVLAVVVAAVGPALTLFPLGVLRLVVGGLLAVFGIMWLRKAILRASGYKGLHDEAGIYERQVAAARAAETGGRHGVRDWYAFTLSFKGVLLEGLEVVFIAITFGDNQGNLGLAALAAATAVLVIAGVGIAARAPLARVPENTMKFAVGVMLTSFGTFWGAEGAGVHWPGNDAALLVIIPAIAVVCLAYTALLRRARAATPADVPPPAAPAGATGPARPRHPVRHHPVRHHRACHAAGARSPPRRCPDEPLAPLVRRVLVRLRHRGRLARGRGRRLRAGPDRAAGPRGGRERLVAASGWRDRRARLVAAPRHQGKLSRALPGRGSRPAAPVIRTGTAEGDPVVTPALAGERAGRVAVRVRMSGR